MNPPAIFIEDSNTADEAKTCGIDCGKYPPPKINNPPTAVIPEMAFVIDIKGVWRAGVTPQTLKYPAINESEKILDMVKILGSWQTNPNPNIPARPVASPKADFNVFWKGGT